MSDDRTLVEALDEPHLPPKGVRRHDTEVDNPNHLLSVFLEAGLYTLLIPQEMDGLGGTWRTLSLVQKRLGQRAFMAAALCNRVVCYGLTKLLRTASAYQNKEFLPRLMAGEGGFVLALTETRAGSDAGALNTRARRDGSGWSLNSRKTWINGRSKAPRPDVVARTGPDSSGSHGTKVFLVPAEAAGLSITMLEKVGKRCLPSRVIGIDYAALSDTARIGAEGVGFAAVRESLYYSRSGRAAAPTGTDQAAVDAAAAHRRALSVRSPHRCLPRPRPSTRAHLDRGRSRPPDRAGRTGGHKNSQECDKRRNANHGERKIRGGRRHAALLARYVSLCVRTGIERDPFGQDRPGQGAGRSSDELRHSLDRHPRQSAHSQSGEDAPTMVRPLPPTEARPRREPVGRRLARPDA